MAAILLKYSDSSLFEFIRSPERTTALLLVSIPEYSVNTQAPPMMTTIQVGTRNRSSESAFPYRQVDMDVVGKYAFSSTALSPRQKERIFQVFVQAVLNGRGPDQSLFVTEDRVLLRTRLWFEAHFPGRRLNIVTINEAAEMMDLFAKYNQTFLLASIATTRKWHLYWLSFRTKVPFFNVPSTAVQAAGALRSSNYLDAFSSRMIYLLMSVDELGFQHYLGVDNDTEENTMYHFNYAISLISSIFDSLALETKGKLSLHFRDEHIPSRTSLSKDAGEEFLRAIESRDPILRTHIRNHSAFINLISQLRQLAIHREGFLKLAYEKRGAQGETWKSIFIPIDQDISNKVKHALGRRLIPYEEITGSGIHEIGTRRYLQPFHFVKAAAGKLSQFSSRYLELLGYPNYMTTVTHPQFSTESRLYSQNKLGF